MSVPAGYKASEVGVIPEDWQVKTLGSICPMQRGFDLPKRRIRPGDFPIVYSNGPLGTHNHAMVKGPGIVTGRSGTIGNIHFMECDFWPHNTALWVTSFCGNDRLFVRYLLDTIDLKNLATGSGVPTLNRNDVHPVRVALPAAVTEQAAIAEALSDVDEAIATAEAVIAKKRALKTAMMQALLSGTLRLPGFSGEWTKTPIGQIGRWVGGATPSMANPRYWTNGTTPWASSSDVRDGRLSSTANLITKDAVKSTATREVPKDTILLVTRSGILRRFLPVAITTRNIAINQDLKALLVGPAFDPHFIYHAIAGTSGEILSTCMKAGTTVESIDLDWLKLFELLVPNCRDEQSAIAAALFDADDELSALESKLAKLRRLKKGMMQQLLTGKIRLV